jgi:hypothetical protein
LECGGVSPPLLFFDLLSGERHSRRNERKAKTKAAEKHRRTPNQTAEVPWALIFRVLTRRIGYTGGEGNLPFMKGVEDEEA